MEPGGATEEELVNGLFAELEKPTMHDLDARAAGSGMESFCTLSRKPCGCLLDRTCDKCVAATFSRGLSRVEEESKPKPSRAPAPEEDSGSWETYPSIGGLVRYEETELVSEWMRPPAVPRSWGAGMTTLLLWTWALVELTLDTICVMHAWTRVVGCGLGFDSVNNDQEQAVSRSDISNDFFLDDDEVLEETRSEND